MSVQSIAAQLTAIFLTLQLLQLLAVNSEDPCITKEGITKEDIAAFEKADQKTLENNPKIQCYFTCIMESHNITDGCTMKYEEAKQRALKERALNMTMALDACKDKIKRKKRCECGFQAYKCIDDFMTKLRN